MPNAARDILLIGDRDRHVHDALATALPHANVTDVDNIFDGLAELHARRFDAVLTATEPIERRPEPAVDAIRRLIGDGRLVLFGNTTLEPLNRKMLDFGCDDYLVTPADPAELRDALARTNEPLPSPDLIDRGASQLAVDPTPSSSPINADDLLDATMQALVAQPQASVKSVVATLAARLPGGWTLSIEKDAELLLPTVSHPIRNTAGVVGHLHVGGPASYDHPAAAQAAVRVASVLSKVAVIEERHALMQRLAITDELTGLYNARYFNHFLTRILDKAKAKRFAVTLLLFDIDNFKRYNDTFGHGVGDEILRQTGQLMKRCCRDHDLVARIGGDEFAVVFWEKEPPRQPRDHTGGHARVPSTPMIIAQRFRKQLGSSEFNALGPAGKGVLTISGGMAVYPFDGQSAADLIKAADAAQMFGAKKSGKNSIHLVGGEASLASGDP